METIKIEEDKWIEIEEGEAKARLEAGYEVFSYNGQGFEFFYKPKIKGECYAIDKKGNLIIHFDYGEIKINSDELEDWAEVIKRAKNVRDIDE